MTIYAVDDSILYEAPITKDALIKCVLMGDHYIELPFSTGQYLAFPRGSYIIHDNAKFVVLETNLPEPMESGGYRYSIKFWGIENLMKNRKVFWLKGSNKESHFHNTTSLDQFGQLIVDNMNEFVGEWGLGSVPEDKMSITKLITFNGVSCWDALADIAEQFGVEWWVQPDYDRVSLSFGKREYGTRVDVKVGEIITSIPSSQGNDSNFGTRFYVYGSTKNLPSDYNDTAQGGVVNHVSESRLRMSDEEYIDVKLNMTPAEIVEQVVIFEDIFPKNTDTVTDVSTVERKIEGATEESDQQTFTAYQVTAANTPFVPSDVIAGEDFKIRFTSGMLSGWEFGVDLRDDNDNRIDPSSWKESSSFNKKFEIVAITEQAGDRVITTPNDSMYPVKGDTFVLIGVILPEERVKEAEIELRVRGEEWAREHSADTDVYNCPTNPVYCAKEGVNFNLGQNVKLIDPRFEGGYRNSRIQGYEKSLWNESIATYTIGDNTPYTRIGSIESTVREISTTSKTIGVILDNLSKTATNLQEMFAFEEDSRGKRIRAKYGLYSVDFISAKGVNFSQGGGSSGGGSSTLSGLNDVLLTSLASDNMLVYNGTHWVNTPMSAIKPDLSAYATKFELNTVSLRLSNVETIFEADSDGAINKWSEVVAFLDGIEGDTLDSILSQFATMQWVEGKQYLTADALTPYALTTAIPTNNNQLINGAGYITSNALLGYATQSWVEAKRYLTAITSSMVVSALGYVPYNSANFTKANIKSTLGISDWALATSKPSYAWSEISNRPTSLSQFTDDVVSGYYLPIDGTAKNAEKLGGQAPVYYATATDLTTFKTLFDSLFELDEENNAIKAKLPLYSVGGITAKGLGDVSSGGGGGGGVSYDRLDSWDAYTSSMAVYVLSAALGYDLHTRLGVVERAGYATTSDLDTRINALVNGAPAAYDTLKEIADALEGNVNSIGDIITTLGVKADKATTLAGYGITDAYTATQVDSKLAEYSLKTGGSINGRLALNYTSTEASPDYQALSIKSETTSDIVGQPAIGFHIPNVNWGILKFTERGFEFRNNNLSSMMNVYANTFVGNLQGNADGAKALLGRSITDANNAPNSFGWINPDASGINVPFAGNLITFVNDENVGTQLLSDYNSDTLYYRAKIGINTWTDWQTIIHTGNLNDRTLVRGAHLISDVDFNDLKSGIYDNETGNGSGNLNAPDSYWGQYGVLIALSAASPYNFAAQFHVHNSGNIQTRGYYSNTWSPWKTIAFVDSNVASATKLATHRTIWGQSFDGTTDISGRMSSHQSLIPSMTTIDNVLGSENLWIHNFNAKFSSANNAIVIAVSGVENERSAMIQSGHGIAEYAQYLGSLLLNPLGGNVGVNTNNPTAPLHVKGKALITDSTTIEKSLFVNKNIYIAESSSDGGIYFGDDEYAYIKETPDDVMTIASNQGLILRVNHMADMGAVIRLDGPVRIGDALLEWDAANKGLKLSHADGSTAVGLYASGYLTAKAANYQISTYADLEARVQALETAVTNLTAN